MFGMNGFHVSASGAIQGHHGPLVADTGIFWSLRSDKQMDMKLFTEFLFLKKNDPSKNMAFMEDSFSSYGTK